MGLVVSSLYREIATSPVVYKKDFRTKALCLVGLVVCSYYREMATSPVDYINRQVDFRTNPCGADSLVSL